MVMTLATPPSLPTQPTTATASSCCPGCGYSLPALDDTHAQLLQAQSRIQDLENQVRLLNEKASAAVDRWADYEDELARLREQLPQGSPEMMQQQYQNQLQPQNAPQNNRMSFLQSGTSRLSALLAPRKSTPDLRALDTRNHSGHRNITSPVPPPSPSNEDLLEALNREQNLRKEAETQVAATSKEIEELSAALFEQANEMVAEERRARARLEERVGELERRDNQKRQRLEKLEGAMNRIQRVRLLLAEQDDTQSLDTDDSSVFESEHEHDIRQEKPHTTTTQHDQVVKVQVEPLAL